MKRNLLFAAIMLVSLNKAVAFCGFYVAKADSKIFNESSQVILVRDGDHTVITMSNDFKGDVKDFAIVIPVPVVLKENDIRVVNQMIFDKIDAYTAPRLVEYWDENPCQETYVRTLSAKAPMTESTTSEQKSIAMDDADFGVTVEAKYSVGEYDILVLSAKESDGLKVWLNMNGYKLPPNAEEVLDPYIADGTKFFVAKVNLQTYSQSGFVNLRPLQIQFDSPKFMLPIRLGMANSSGTQDLLVYGFSRKGRIEVSNYRTTKLPTDREIPEFVQTHGIFPDFYKSLYDKAWRSEGRNTAMLEYAWDISGQQSVKCDPCPTPLITFQELREAGVWWITGDSWGQNYAGDLFVTRLHVRYGRERFPQDLQFIATPNKQNFQGRYVIRHAAYGPFDCPEGKRYEASLKNRRKNEVEELASLTGWDANKYAWYYGEASQMPEKPKSSLEPIKDGQQEADKRLGTVSDTLEVTLASSMASAEPVTGTSSDTSAFIERAKLAAANPVNKRQIILYIGLALLFVGVLYRKYISRKITAEKESNI